MKILEQKDYNDLILENILNNIIFENIYQYDIFDIFINLCFKKYINNNIFQEYKGVEIIDYLSSFWNNLKYFNINKNLKICFVNDQIELITMLNKIQFLTFNEISNILLAFNKDFAFFTTDFKNNINQSIIVVNLQKCKSKNLILKKLIHQFIHYLQWNTGKKLHQFKLNNINNKKMQSINLYYKYYNLNIEKIINNIINNEQFETYINEVYYILKNLSLSKNIQFNKELIKKFISCFQIFSKTQDFQSYIKNTKLLLLKNIQLEDFLIYDQHIFIVIIFYLHLKINTFKNHIYGYYFKEFPEKI